VQQLFVVTISRVNSAWPLPGMKCVDTFINKDQLYLYSMNLYHFNDDKTLPGRGGDALLWQQLAVIYYTVSQYFMGLETPSESGNVDVCQMQSTPS
jgi:hypothetical protein